MGTFPTSDIEGLIRDEERREEKKFTNRKRTLTRALTREGKILPGITILDKPPLTIEIESEVVRTQVSELLVKKHFLNPHLVAFRVKPSTE